MSKRDEHWMEPKYMFEPFLCLLLGLVAALCAYRAMISKHLLPSALYLACVSAMTSILLYMLGASEVAMIELSVGAGLVTVLLVYALSVVGEDTYDPTSIIPKPLAFLLVTVIALIAGGMAYSSATQPSISGDVLLAEVLWKDRALDVWVQVALIFSGVMGVLGLLSEQVQMRQTQKSAQRNTAEGLAMYAEQEAHV
jgi:uncharacterized MnhB-related membrane protein